MTNDPKNKTIDDFFAEVDIHDRQRERKGGLLTGAVALVTLAVECLLVYWGISADLSIGFVLFLHAIVVGLLAVYARSLLSRGGENRFALLLLLTTATTGPYGAAGVMLSIALTALFMRHAQTFEQWYESIFPSLVPSTAQRIYSDLVTGRDESGKSYSVIPFLDVLSFGNERQKRQALAIMSSHFDPSFAPAFRKALGDASNTIRVQAATAISKVENSFMERLMKLSALKERFPKEPVVVLALAGHYDNYAYTGLLDADREQSNRQRALAHYRELLEIQPENIEVRMHIGRILMREKEYKEASSWFRQCMDLGYNSEAICQWYAEALFHCGRFEELRRFSASYKPALQPSAASQPVPVKEAIALWASGGRA